MANLIPSREEYERMYPRNPEPLYPTRPDFNPPMSPINSDESNRLREEYRLKEASEATKKWRESQKRGGKSRRFRKSRRLRKSRRFRK